MVRPLTCSLKLETLEARLTLSGDGAYGDVAEVWDLNKEPTGSRVHASAELDGSLYYLVSKDDGDVEFWRTDGTNDGTKRIKEIEANQQGKPVVWSGNSIDAGEIWTMATVGGQIYFAFDSITLNPSPWTWFNGELQIWKSDGTTEGTTIVHAFPSWFSGGDEYWQAEIADADGSLLVAASHVQQEYTAKLWSFDETGDVFRPYSQTFHQSWHPAIRDVVQFNETTYFLGTQMDGTAGLWATNPGGETMLVKEFVADIWLPNVPVGLTDINGTLFFTADDGDGSGKELWKSDGTAEGTVMVKDVNPGPALGALSRPVWLMDNEIHFLGWDGENISLWTTSGTSDGTLKVVDLPSGLQDVVASGTTMYLRTRQKTSREFEIWKYEKGDLQLLATTNSSIASFESANTSLLFTTFSRNPEEFELWMHNDVTGETNSLGQDFQLVGEIGDKTLIYRGGLLFEMDFTTGVPELLHDDNESSHGAEPVLLTGVADRLFFYSRRDGQLYQVEQDITLVANAPELQLEQFHDGVITKMTATNDALYVLDGNGLWKYDFRVDEGEWLLETTESTELGPVDYMIDADLSDVVFMIDGTLWTSDGTRDGTKRLSSSSLTFPSDLLHGGDRYYTIARAGFTQTLWVSEEANPNWTDLELNGVISMTEYQGELYLVLRQEGKFEIWKTDGTTEGKTLVSRFGVGGFSTSRYSRLVATDEKLFFAEGDGLVGDSGLEPIAQHTRLWAYDPANTDIENSTNLVKRFSPHASPVELANVNGQLFFSAGEESVGRELWVSDGTPEGTVLTAGLSIGPWGSNPSQLTFQNDRLFFVANDVMHGEEIWSIDLRDPPELIGDINNNGEVDFLDFLILAENFGTETAGGSSAGDLNENGTVDFLDFIALAENFGGKRDRVA